MMAAAKIDFFVSYNHADEQWAIWIATVIEDAGYSCVIQAWDFRPGGNFVLEMQEAAKNATRMVAVLSPAYLGSEFTAPEWAAVFATDPMGTLRSLVPVRIAPCDPPGLLAPIIYIDLVGLDEDAATKKLLGGLAPGRAKPAKAAPFPGTSVESSAAIPATPLPALSWKLASDIPKVTWHAAGRRTGLTPAGGSLVEVHLVPLGQQRLAMRQLQSLSEQLVSAGRRGGLFTETLGVTCEASEDVVSAQIDPSRGVDRAGLMVVRDGQRGGWLTLPHDSLGSVLDPSELRPRLAALLSILLELPVGLAERYALAIGLSDLTLLSVGDANVVGRRTGATMRFTNNHDLQIPPEDSVGADALRVNVDEVADEITARLVAALT